MKATITVMNGTEEAEREISLPGAGFDLSDYHRVAEEATLEEAAFWGWDADDCCYRISLDRCSDEAINAILEADQATSLKSFTVYNKEE